MRIAIHESFGRFFMLFPCMDLYMTPREKAENECSLKTLCLVLVLFSLTRSHSEVDIRDMCYGK